MRPRPGSKRLAARDTPARASAFGSTGGAFRAFPTSYVKDGPHAANRPRQEALICLQQPPPLPLQLRHAPGHRTLQPQQGRPGPPFFPYTYVINPLATPPVMGNAAATFKCVKATSVRGYSFGVCIPQMAN